MLHSQHDPVDDANVPLLPEAIISAASTYVHQRHSAALFEIPCNTWPMVLCIVRRCCFAGWCATRLFRRVSTSAALAKIVTSSSWFSLVGTSHAVRCIITATFILCTGSFSAVTDMPGQHNQGSTIVVGSIPAGAIFGELGLLTGGKRAVGVVAKVSMPHMPPKSIGSSACCLLPCKWFRRRRRWCGSPRTSSKIRGCFSYSRMN